MALSDAKFGRIASATCRRAGRIGRSCEAGKSSRADGHAGTKCGARGCQARASVSVGQIPHCGLRCPCAGKLSPHLFRGFRLLFRSELLLDLRGDGVGVHLVQGGGFVQHLRRQQYVCDSFRRIASSSPFLSSFCSSS